MTLDLAKVGSTKDGWEPQRILMYSVQGLGKNTFGSTFETPFLFSFEDGSSAVDMATFLDDGGKPKVLGSFAEVVEGIEQLHGEHGFRTLVLDTLDWLEPLVWAKLVQARPVNDKGMEVKHPEDYGYGKGFGYALDWWRYIQGGLDSLRHKRGMTIVLLAHAETKRYDSPIVDPYDRYQIKLQKQAFAFWQEWSDLVLFANYKTRVAKADVGFGNQIVRGEGSGERVIYTEERPAFLAKNRWGLPPEIFIGADKTWGAFHHALADATDGRYEIPNNLKAQESKS